MKVVILAGGKGTRLSEETHLKPKPMVEIGGKPILWHIMKLYSRYGFDEFIICCGYKGYMIKEYFVHYHTYQSNVSFDLHDESMTIHENAVEPWKVTLVDTGLETLTAGRLIKVRDFLNGEAFMCTYGDGVSDVNLEKLLDHHKVNGRIATISSTRPEGRFGAIKINQSSYKVESFKEKARKDQSWVNIGFMVFEPDIYEYLGDGSTMLETLPFERLAEAGQMTAYPHNGFWSPMDTIRDKEYLDQLWYSKQAPWIL